LKKHVVFSIALAGMVSIAAASQAGTELTASWSDGLSLQSADKTFKVKIGGRIMNDWAWFSQGDSNEAYYGNIQDGTEFRRARLGMSGTVHKYVLFKAEFEFAGAAKAGKEVAFKDVYMGVSGIPVLGTVQIGHQKEPIGLEVLTSSNALTFMERGVTSSAEPERNTGIRMQNAYAGQRVSLTAGLFRETDDAGRNSKDGAYSGTVRLTGLPWVDDETGGLFHVGGAYSLRNPRAEAGYAARPSAHLAPEFLEIRGIAVDATTLMEGEGAFTYGRFRAQGQYILATLDANAAGDPSFQAYYVYGSALLTGERYGFKKSEAAFEAVKPNKVFRENGGVGTWEVGVRYGFLDLNDQDIYGGEMTDITVGLNWYVTSNARVMFNYVHASVENAGAEGRDQGTMDCFQTRFHIFF
jgi:phosphate-selective porin OprO/OprP